MTAVELADTVGDAVEEIPVVRDHDHRAAVSVQLFFQPRRRLVVDVVGRLVQNQNFARIDEGGDDRDALFLSAGQQTDGFVEVEDVQLGQHGLCLIRPLLGKPFVRAAEHLLEHGDVLGEVRRLRQITDARAVCIGHRSLVRLLLSRQNAQEGGFPGAVDPDEADLVVLLQRKLDVVEHLVFSPVFRDVFRVQQYHNMLLCAFRYETNRQNRPAVCDGFLCVTAN